MTDDTDGTVGTDGTDGTDRKTATDPMQSLPPRVSYRLISQHKNLFIRQKKSHHMGNIVLQNIRVRRHSFTLLSLHFYPPDGSN